MSWNCDNPVLYHSAFIYVRFKLPLLSHFPFNTEGRHFLSKVVQILSKLPYQNLKIDLNIVSSNYDINIRHFSRCSIGCLCISSTHCKLACFKTEYGVSLHNRRSLEFSCATYATREDWEKEKILSPLVWLGRYAKNFNKRPNNACRVG